MKKQEIVNSTNYNYDKIEELNSIITDMQNKLRSNIIINGAMDIWQRGTTTSDIPSNNYTADRFKFNISSSGAVSTQQSSDTPDDSFNYSLLLTVTTADTSITSTEYSRIEYCVEGYDYKRLIGKGCVLSFWVKSSVTGTYSVAFRNNTPDRSYIVEYTINTANTWEQKHIHIVFNESSGTWDTTKNTGVSIDWMLACGSTYQSTKDSWLTGNYIATSSQTNFLNTTSSTFRLAGVQLVEGSIELPFLHRPVEEELSLCQRYFEKSYNLDVAPGTSSTYGEEFFTASHGSTNRAPGGNFRVSKRSTPSIALYSTNSGTSGNIYCLSSSSDVSAGVYGVGRDRIGFVGFTGTDGYEYNWHWTADAEL